MATTPNFGVYQLILKLEKVAFNDVMPRKADQQGSISNLTSVGAFESELQTDSMSFRLESLWT